MRNIQPSIPISNAEIMGANHKNMPNLFRNNAISVQGVGMYLPHNEQVGIPTIDNHHLKHV